MRSQFSRTSALAFCLVAASLVVVAPANAADGTCTVHNVTQGKSYGPDTGYALAVALNAARGGDDLQVTGACHDDYHIPKLPGILTIEGAADGSTVITQPPRGEPALTVLHHRGHAGVHLEHLTFLAVAGTWVIYNHGNLQLRRVSVIDNIPFYSAIESIKAARLLIVHSVIARNTAGSGSAIVNRDQGWLLMKHSSVVDNVGPAVGGIDNEAGALSARSVASVIKNNNPVNCFQVVHCKG